MGEMINVHNSLVGKPEERKTLRRSRRRWEDNIRMDFREIRCEDDWMHLAQDRYKRSAVVNMVIKFRVL